MQNILACFTPACKISRHTCIHMQNIPAYFTPACKIFRNILHPHAKYSIFRNILHLHAKYWNILHPHAKYFTPAYKIFFAPTYKTSRHILHPHAKYPGPRYLARGCKICQVQTGHFFPFFSLSLSFSLDLQCTCTTCCNVTGINDPINRLLAIFQLPIISIDSSTNITAL